MQGQPSLGFEHHVCVEVPLPSRFHPVGLVLAAGLVCGCQEAFQPLAHELIEGAEIRISTATTTYAPGAEVALRLENLGDVEYIWNPCIRTLERSTPRGWTPADEGDRVCTLEGWLLESGETTDASTWLAGGLPTGEYRLRYCFNRMESDATVSDFQVSNTFTITR